MAVFVRNESVSQVVPDLPAQRRATLICWHDVGVGQVNSPRLRLQHNKTRLNFMLYVHMSACFLKAHSYRLMEQLSVSLREMKSNVQVTSAQTKCEMDGDERKRRPLVVLLFNICRSMRAVAVL